VRPRNKFIDRGVQISRADLQEHQPIRGLLVVGVDTQDLEAPARAFLGQYGVTYLNLRDPDGGVGRLFGTTGVPETFFIDAAGRIQGKFPGEQLDPAIWRRAADALLAGRRPVP